MKTVRLAFVGDVMLHGKIANDCKKNRGTEIFASVSKVFNEVDGTVLNLECAYPTEETGPKEPRVISSSEAIESVSLLKPIAVCLANNHIFDCGRSGFISLTNLLETMDLNYFGAGLNYQDAREGLIFEIKGCRLGFIGYVDKISNPTCIARDDFYGVALYEESEVLDSIAKLKCNCDHVVVCLHWGQEHLMMPSPIQINAAHKFIDAGSTFVIGHHPHVLQAVERYKGGLIAYSLGNFITTESVLDNGYKIPWSKEALKSCILIADIGDEGVECYEQIPTIIKSGCVSVLSGENAKLHIQNANDVIKKKVTTFRYKKEYFRKRVINSISSLIKRRGILFIRPRHFKMLFSELKAIFSRNGIKKNS